MLYNILLGMYGSTSQKMLLCVGGGIFLNTLGGFVVKKDENPWFKCISAHRSQV